jgi:hypothetical protein
MNDGVAPPLLEGGVTNEAGDFWAGEEGTDGRAAGRGMAEGGDEARAPVGRGIEDGGVIIEKLRDGDVGADTLGGDGMEDAWLSAGGE